jgi:hypothetical protein
MKYTNIHGLPEVFVRAVENDPYSRGDSDFSATSLSEPPRAQALKIKYERELKVDVSSRVASIIGQGMHSIAERAARPKIDICEQRFFLEVRVDNKDYRVSAQVDLYEKDTETLYDWKSTKAYAFSRKAGGGLKPEWITQLNVGAELMRRNGYKVKGLFIIALLKDWDQRKAGIDHPISEVCQIEIPLWESNEVIKFIKSRIRAHISARANLPLCDKEENWNMRRCDRWCDANSVCSQFQDSIKTGLMLIKEPKEKNDEIHKASDPSSKWDFPTAKKRRK